jgi:hypothetical protein
LSFDLFLIPRSRVIGLCTACGQQQSKEAGED